jgi:hypothetical protein
LSDFLRPDKQGCHSICCNSFYFRYHLLDKNKESPHVKIAQINKIKNLLTAANSRDQPTLRLIQNVQDVPLCQGGAGLIEPPYV